MSKRMASERPRALFFFGSAGIGSWAEAKEYCKEKGGFLAEIPNEQINSYLYDNIKTNSNLQKKWWWIGANDIANVSLIFLFGIMLLSAKAHKES
jgi:hypothetical protein